MCVENIIYIYMICRLYTIVHCMIWICIAFCYCSMICCSYNHMHPCSHPSVCPSIRPSIHPPTCTYTAVHYTAVHYTASCYIALHYITLHCVTLHCVAVLSQFYHIILHYIPWHCVACYMALPTHTQIVYICTYTYIYIYIQQRRNRTTISVCGRWLNAAWPGWRKIGRVRSVPRSASPNRVTYWKNTQLLIHLSLETTALRLVQSYDLRLLTSLLSDSVIERSEAHIYIYIHTYV